MKEPPLLPRDTKITLCCCCSPPPLSGLEKKSQQNLFSMLKKNHQYQNPMCVCVCVCGLDLRKKITPFEPGPPTHHTPHTALVARSLSPWFLRLRSLVDAADRLLNNSAPPEPRREPAHRGAASPSPEMPHHQPAPRRLRSLCFPAPMTLPPPLQNQNFFFSFK